MKKFICSLLIAHCSLLFLPAQDFGVIVNQEAIFADEGYIENTTAAIPWFSAPLGERADLYLSGGLSAYLSNNEWKPIFDIYRFEVSFNPLANLRFSIGRQNFEDSTGWIMNGLFDGAALNWDIGGGRLNAGLFYTGLLYKKNAYITISPNDIESYYDDGNYWASRRLAGGINWNKTSIFDTQANMALSAIFQVDLNDAASKIHSQYLAAQFSVPLAASLNLDLGASLELLEIDDNFKAAFAGSAVFQQMFYGSRPGILSFGGRYASGDWGDSMAAFIPINCEPLGKVLRPVFSGIALAEAAYALRLHRTFLTELYASYAFRTDQVTFYSPGLNDSDSPFLGMEIYLGLSWAPFSDLVFSLGGGVFLPQTGTAFADDTKTKYRIELTAGISF